MERKKVKLQAYEKRMAEESETLHKLAIRLCGFGYYDTKGVPVEYVEKYLELGAIWHSTGKNQ